MEQEQLLSGAMSSDSGNNHGTGYAVLVRCCARMQDASFDLNEFFQGLDKGGLGTMQLPRPTRGFKSWVPWGGVLGSAAERSV